MFEYNTKSQKLQELKKSNLQMEKIKERTDFQKAIIHSWDNIKIQLGLSPETSLIDEEVEPHHSVGNRIDLLAFDPEDGELIVIELKRDKDKFQLLQALTYAAMVSNWDKNKLTEIIEQSKITKGTDKKQLLDDINKLSDLENPIKIILLSERYDPEVIITAEWLKRDYNLNITAFSCSLYKMNNKLLLNITQKFPLKEIEDMYVHRKNQSKISSKQKNIEWKDIIKDLQYKDTFGEKAVQLCLKETHGEPGRTRFTSFRTPNNHIGKDYDEFPYKWISLWFRQKYMRVYINSQDFCRNSGHHAEAIKFLKEKTTAEIKEWRDGYSLIIKTKEEYTQIKNWLKIGKGKK